ncbi:MAG TPA: GMC family oxidoreductase [Steroidobacteraceae bacterium]|nr:GMC family oxidoreductase [Steroidobacteraceae bacterium]
MLILTHPEEYDAIVVGSGASGGWAAKRMSEAGMRVALVCAGRPLTDGDYREHVQPYELKYQARANDLIRRKRPVQKDCYACTEYNESWFCNDIDEPYTTPEGKPFSWQGRMRVTGGRTNVWGRQSYRYSQQDLKGYSFDGHGADWPLDYKDLVPYYELVEDYVGISGMVENNPELPDSKFLPPMALTCVEEHVRGAVKSKFGRTLTIGRVANLTKPINGRAPCHFCGPCERGCVTHSYFNSAFTTVADALKTGKCTHIPNAMVYQVLMDPKTHKARGVSYVDRVTRETREIRAKSVVLCAQALESTRILLNSAPGGLANSSGVLGEYLMDHMWVAGGGAGEFPDMPGKPSLNTAHRPNGLYVIRFRNTANGPRHKDFVRGYGFQGGSQLGFRMSAPGFGQAYKDAVKDGQWTLEFSGFGECLAYKHNRVTINKNVTDVFGIPVLHIDMSWGDNEKAIIRDMAVSAGEMLEAAGAKNIRTYFHEDRIPGYGIHEMGGARMGSDPKQSVLNQFQQTHDVKNLFVMDASGFPSGGCQNPTLTIMAMAVRSTDYLMEQFRKRNL